MTQNLPRAILFGDSQAEGLSPFIRDALGPLFNVVSITAQRGISTRVLIDSGKVRDMIAMQHPDVVIFVQGGNDTAGSAYEDTLIETIAFTEGLPVIWVGPAMSTDPEVDARHRAVSQQQHAVLPTLGVTWLDSRAWTQDGHAADGVHFTRAAYEAQAHAIAAKLESLRGPSPWLVGLAVVGGIVALGGAGYAAWRSFA